METLEAVDMTQLIMGSHELSTMINQSREVSEYLEAKRQMEADEEVQRLLVVFEAKKEQYEDVQRFGKYHPDYNHISKEVRELKRNIELRDSVQAFKRAEDALDELLYQVSRTIAHSVSETIKVPSNNPFLEAQGSGCGTGGSCGCSVKKPS
ncbi:MULTISPECIES: YlbF family regulator [Bacillales]|uniref:Regulatory protein YlbF n=1 Tax=Brevibacillus brevis (strain 47 / JCM 6285 / NBRC 100599) TaxID=358681 RepID=C0ZBV0_BREBN|nr:MULTISPECIES: YlbF family regulator [Bacillales]KMZ41398.1 regulator [Bacillus sp. FJAT-27238]MBH0329422.1 regulator [Brevibacillus brevis]NRR03275.1 YlbF family regulator [Brevibacillus sp. RS1.1]NRS47339.1 YlbF family regulator [Brevibacillus sp. HB2.2]OUQ89606.1 regulator [Brevibacillus brevis]